MKVLYKTKEERFIEFDNPQEFCVDANFGFTQSWGREAKFRRQKPEAFIAIALPEKQIEQKVKANIKQEFDALVQTWKRATSRFSIITQKIIHPAYLRIIGMGEKALPLILRELQQNPSIGWFTALEAISGENAALEAESIDQAISDWLDWGEERHYL